MSETIMQELAKEISAMVPHITATVRDGKFYLGLRVFVLNGETEQQKMADIIDHLKYVAIGLKWVVGTPPNVNKLQFVSKPLYETKQKETTLHFQRSACSCCHSEPHTFSIITPMESREEDIQLDLMMSAFKHLLNE